MSVKQKDVPGAGDDGARENPEKSDGVAQEAAVEMPGVAPAVESQVGTPAPPTVAVAAMPEGNGARGAETATEQPVEKKTEAPGNKPGVLVPQVGGVRITPSSPLMQPVQVPEVLPLLPVREQVGFPGSVMPLTVGRPRSKKLLDDALTADKIIGAVTQKSEHVEDPGPGDLYPVGTASLVLKMIRSPEGHLNILTHGLVRFRIVEVVGTEPYLKARVEILPD